MRVFAAALLLLGLAQTITAQSRRNDIPTSQLPDEVKSVLGKYIAVLSQSESLDQCANAFVAIAGGSLVNEDGETLRNTVKPYSLKKDFQNVKFYALNPIRVTRVNVRETTGTGYGWSALKGKIYKVWIKKAPGQPGMPAPISIIVPEGHESITSPKVVGIGSL